MITVQVNSATFTKALQKYQAMTGKAMGDVVKEQAKLLANRLTQLTYPKTAAIGKRRVAVDIAKVYLRNEWFENVFQFRNKSLGERVKSAVKAKNTQELESVFQRSQALQKLHVDAFDKDKHRKARKGGRVSYKNPYSFPVAEQGKVKALTDEKKKKVGFAKSGWASCYQALGGNSPGWLNQSSTGSVDDQSQQQPHSQITLTNHVRYFDEIDSKANIVGRAMEGRARDMMKAAQNALQRAKSKAGIYP